jgi:hypothetical protein
VYGILKRAERCPDLYLGKSSQTYWASVESGNGALTHSFAFERTAGRIFTCLLEECLEGLLLLAFSVFMPRRSSHS